MGGAIAPPAPPLATLLVRTQRIGRWQNVAHDVPDLCAQNTARRVARIWKRGGLFWKSEKCANDLDSNFHWSWINFRWFGRNLRRNVSESSEIQRFFPPKIRWSPKKKKVFAKIRSDFSAEIRNSKVFSAQNQVISKKKGLLQNVWGVAVFEWGGLFSIFHIKSASKAQKACDFAYFTSQWGGARAPPAPPLATLLNTAPSHAMNAMNEQRI